MLLSVQRHFVRLHAVQDVLINEGLRRWDVRYFLAVVTPEASVHVAFQVLNFQVLFAHLCLTSSSEFAAAFSCIIRSLSRHPGMLAQSK